MAKGGTSEDGGAVRVAEGDVRAGGAMWAAPSASVSARPHLPPIKRYYVLMDGAGALSAGRMVGQTGAWDTLAFPGLTTHPFFSFPLHSPASVPLSLDGAPGQLATHTTHGT